MSQNTIAEATLIPDGGGDPIPLTRDTLTVGRRESCDICLKFNNISSLHCEFFFKNGYWSIRDKGSTNGVKVNGVRTPQPRGLRPGDEVAIANRPYKIVYALTPEGESALDKTLDAQEDYLATSLMEKAGLTKSKSSRDDD